VKWKYQRYMQDYLAGLASEREVRLAILFGPRAAIKAPSASWGTVT